MLIDGLQCGYFSREVFSQLRDAGVSCVTPTLGFWENTNESLLAIDQWRKLVRENADIATIVRTTGDIDQAVKDNKLAILPGFQNTALLEGRIAYVELFADLGVRVLQLTYNNQNDLGGSCYEESDSGLARFGREVIKEMNQTGIVIDLSHVGNRTSIDAIEYSQKPVAITHANPSSLYEHKRNKTDDVLKALAANDGVLGCATYRNIVGEDWISSLDKWCEMVARTVELIGIDHVGIGTDRSHNTTVKDLDWMRMGHWTRGVDYGAGSASKPGKVPPADWFTSLSNFADFEGGLARQGFNDEEVGKITGGNWYRLYQANIG